MLKNNIPTYQACANIVTWIKSTQLLHLSDKTLHHLFAKNINTHPHPLLFILKNLYRKSLSELNDESFAQRLGILFNLINPSQLNKMNRSLINKMIIYSLEKNFIECAKVIKDVFMTPEEKTTLTSSSSVSQVSSLSAPSILIDTTTEESTDSSVSNNHITIDEFSDQLKAEGICPSIFIKNFLQDFRRTSLSTQAYAEKISTVPHCLFYHSILIKSEKSEFKQSWPILHLLANVTNSEVRTQKLLAICDYIGMDNVIGILKQHNEHCNKTGLSLIAPSQTNIFNQAICRV